MEKKLNWKLFKVRFELRVELTKQSNIYGDPTTNVPTILHLDTLSISKFVIIILFFIPIIIITCLSQLLTTAWGQPTTANMTRIVSLFFIIILLCSFYTLILISFTFLGSHLRRPTHAPGWQTATPMTTPSASATTPRQTTNLRPSCAALPWHFMTNVLYHQSICTFSQLHDNNWRRHLPKWCVS
jgi:hypothetical protein